jgi:peptidoglycan/xylan/chitin deacetylase (PgdA/CDA1 family)
MSTTSITRIGATAVAALLVASAVGLAGCGATMLGVATSVSPPGVATPPPAPAAPAPVAAPAVESTTSPAVVYGAAAGGIVRAGRSVRFDGYVLGRHGDGARVVKVEVTQRSGTRWVAYASGYADGTFSRGATRFSKVVHIPRRGDWRIRAVHAADAESGAGSSKPSLVRAVGAKVIALTFDDGPVPGATDSVLDALAGYGVKATFFMLGAQAKASPATASKVARAGHVVGDHSYTHSVLTRLSASRIAWELDTTAKMIRRAIGHRPVWFRPPYGATNSTVRAVARDNGFRHVVWDIDPQDWRGGGASKTAAHVVSHAYPGAVVLMHDGPAKRIGTAAATKAILKALSRKGYDFVTLDELSALTRKWPGK